MKPIPIAQYLAQFGRAEPTELQAPRRESVLLKPRLAPVLPDVETLVEEAFARGRREGVAAGLAEADEAAARGQSERERRDADDRIGFQEGEYAHLADQISAGLVEIEERIAASVARILKPYLEREHSGRVVQALTDNLGRILSGDAPPVLKISGPESVLGELRKRLVGFPAAVEYRTEGGVDVTIEAQHTVIASQLQAWIDHIHSIGD